jgi:aldehyde:ferredoxin oxidoreductase
MFGYNGKILKVNLTKGEITEESYDEEFAGMFLGGNGFAAKIIHDSVPPTVDPLSPENMVVFGVGPLTDTLVWGTSRGHLASISPMTSLFGDSNFGGDFAVAQKRSGFDAICVSGKSPSPAYLLVTGTGATLNDARRLWGKTTEETISTLQSEQGKGAVCASIGPAGENRVLFANVILGGKRPGAAGRCGIGAVMGSKNLKAVVVKGSKRTEVAERGPIAEVLKEKYFHLKDNTRPFKTLGTPFLVQVINSLGMLGTRNNSKEVFDSPGEISGERIKEGYWDKNVACHGCPVACGKMIKTGRGEFRGKVVKMPEYETLYAFGSMLDNADLDSIINANHLCDLMGMDTISMGVTLAFAAECLEKGLTSEKELGGSVKFGEGESVGEIIKMTAAREGVGKHLALGSARLSERLGGDSYKYLHAVKKLEVAGHSPRGLRNMSLSYAVSTRGGSHHDGRPNYAAADPDPGFDPQPHLILKNNRFTSVGDSLVVCRFIAERGLGTPLNESMVKLVNAVTGWSLHLNDLERIGERIYNLERLMNVERGVSRKQDALPYRVLNEPIPDGKVKGRCCPQKDLDKMLDQYYALAGWTKDGIPRAEKLRELGLEG